MTDEQLEQERIEFEKWCMKYGYSTSRMVDKNYYRYFIDQSEARWQAWLAGREALRDELNKHNTKMLESI